MSDTVKLIIEIPKYAHDYVKDGYWVGDSEIIHNAIQNGIPLDDIKTEIEAGIDPLDDSQENIAMIRAYNKVIYIIYTHIGGIDE